MNKKVVYLVTKGEYDYYYVDRIFSKFEYAEKYIEEEKKKEYYSDNDIHPFNEIEIMEVDEEIE